MRSLAFKWVRIIYRCWKDGKPYDEEMYLQSLRRRGSLLGGVLELATGVGWKPATDFHATPVVSPRTPPSSEPRRRSDFR